MSSQLRKTSHNPIQEASKMAAGLESAVQAIVRLLIGRISLDRLLDVVKKAYLKEAQTWLRRQNPNRKVTLARLALLTGTDIRTITRIINSEDYSSPYSSNSQFLSQLTPETRIISQWMSNPQFRDERTGKPRVLSLDDGPGSFSELVFNTFAARGITVNSVLEQLEASQSVKVDTKRRTVKLEGVDYFPFLGANEVGMIHVGLNTVAALAGTVERNIELIAEDRPLLFQRSVFSHEVSVDTLEDARTRLRAMLERADEAGRKVLTKIENSQPIPGRSTVGISLFYFEEK